MAHIHYKYPTTFFSLYLNDNRKSSYTRRDIDFYNDQIFFDYLLKKSILTKEELLNMSLRGQEGYLFINQSLSWQQYFGKFIADHIVPNAFD